MPSPGGAATTSAGSRLDWRVSLPGVPAVAGIARRLVRAALAGSPCAADAELVVSELVTNAIRHTPSGDVGALVSLRIIIRPGRARIEVGDQGDGRRPRPAPPGDEDEHGRGLLIVQALADRVGHQALRSGGQISWAEISWGGTARPAPPECADRARDASPRPASHDDERDGGSSSDATGRGPARGRSAIRPKGERRNGRDHAGSH